MGAAERREEPEMVVEGVAARLIERATNSTAGEVDPRLLRAIKNAARDSEDELRLAARSLMDQMKKKHSQVRYLAVLIIDELFVRSKLFRSLLVPNFDQFLSLSVGFRRNLPLPPPSSIASRLRSKSLEIVEKWNVSFGVHYCQIRLGFDYLKNTLKFQFPNRSENAARLQQERRERELRSKEILLNKFQNLRDNFLSIKGEIQSTVHEVEECLDILSTKNDEFLYNLSEDDDGMGEFQSLTLQQIRLDSLKEGERVHESSENKAVFDALRELHKLLVSKHLVTIQEWMSVLMRVDLTDNKFRDAALKEFIDIRNHIESVRKRCAELGWDVNVAAIEEDDDNIWEEGNIESNLPGETSKSNGCDEDSVETQNPSEQKDVSLSDGYKIPDVNATRGKSIDLPDSSKPSTSNTSSSMSERSRLLAKAPVVSWGPSLENWGSNRDALANQRGLELENHWGRVDYDAVVPAEKIAELNVHRTVYRAEPVEIPPCHAPLKKGGLCQRRDLRACPFHGPIVARDDKGNPLEQRSSTKEDTNLETSSSEVKQIDDQLGEEIILGSEKVMVEKLARQAIKNVKERDREVKSLKRAKLAKVREHNEEVLREAALASTSYSEAAVTNIVEIQGNAAHAKVTKQTLASMLKKKVTAKDRLTRRLLNSRATEASTRQLMQGEDECYREAFPNQW